MGTFGLKILSIFNEEDFTFKSEDVTPGEVLSITVPVSGRAIVTSPGGEEILEEVETNFRGWTTGRLLVVSSSSSFFLPKSKFRIILEDEVQKCTELAGDFDRFPWGAFDVETVHQPSIN